MPPSSSDKETRTLILHEYPFSGNCYKIRLLSSLLKIPLSKIISYDVSKGETRTPAFRSEVDPNGRIPVLEIIHPSTSSPSSPESKTFLPESNAICHYLALGSPLVPDPATLPLEHAEMLRWMFFEQSFVEPSIGSLRYWIRKKGITAENEALVPGKREAGEEALGILDDFLTGKKHGAKAKGFFGGERLGLADVVLFAYVHVAGEAGMGLGRWKGVEEWCERVKGVEGFVGLGC